MDEDKKRTERKFHRFEDAAKEGGYDSRTYSQFSLDRMINTEGAYEGPTNLPKVIQSQRIPSPTKFRILSQEELRGATKFVLAWENQWDLTKWQPEFLIYYYAQSSYIDWHGQSPNTPSFDGPMQGPVIAKASPVEVLIDGYFRKPVVFSIATRLSNGMITQSDLMPRCSGICDPLEHNIIQVSATYAVQPTDDVLCCDTTAGGFTITFPTVDQVPNGWEMWVKNVAAVNNLTVAAAAGNTIDGVPSVVLPPITGHNIFIADRVAFGWRVF